MSLFRMPAVRVTMVIIGLALLGGGCVEENDTPPDPSPQPAETMPNTLTVTEQADGWRLLFDGESFIGWRGLGRDSIPIGHWTIEDGTIRKVASGEVPTAPDGQPLEGGDIMTEDTFGDFELILEWKVAPGANSGIKYNVSEAMSTAHPPNYAALGFEYQILDDDQHPDAQNGPNRTAAALYDLIPPGSSKKLKPVGTFNEARLVFRGPHGEHWLNGEKVVEYDLDTPRFDSLLAASKYHPIDGFAERRQGHIVLQDHGDDVWFRNIKIRELPSMETESEME
ncbi:MAG TPA: DUF1080 domain-containing protein [Rhodothermales bacterium]|nr:DUF1080 domain-containing protein [Rhodothermales bacterium]